eukprot:CAMPEP_0172392114 /NCGR_PEP_ID=MMETSP1061-20121228/8343_1 /TAXON_ID=37318 /ORGANISM="Pseudo-nitzschia pungens, Strain cf. pungens" /LENGTH=446 /DNA_ID=CAMNT_0013122891 /DNA_START=295 /DNA_END=1635 /DNA_ORIENTATION=-
MEAEAHPNDSESSHRRIPGKKSRRLLPRLRLRRKRRRQKIAPQFTGTGTSTPTKQTGSDHDPAKKKNADGCNPALASPERMTIRCTSPNTKIKTKNQHQNQNQHHESLPVLPHTALIEILSFCDHSTLVAFRGVSRSFRYTEVPLAFHSRATKRWKLPHNTPVVPRENYDNNEISSLMMIEPIAQNHNRCGGDEKTTRTKTIAASIATNNDNGNNNNNNNINTKIATNHDDSTINSGNDNSYSRSPPSPRRKGGSVRYCYRKQIWNEDDSKVWLFVRDPTKSRSRQSRDTKSNESTEYPHPRHWSLDMVVSKVLKTIQDFGLYYHGVLAERDENRARSLLLRTGILESRDVPNSKHAGPWTASAGVRTVSTARACAMLGKAAGGGGDADADASLLLLANRDASVGVHLAEYSTVVDGIRMACQIFMLRTVGGIEAELRRLSVTAAV